MGGRGKEFKCQGKCQMDWRQVWRVNTGAEYSTVCPLPQSRRSRHVEDLPITGTSTFEAHWCLGYLSGFVDGFDASEMAVAKTYPPAVGFHRSNRRWVVWKRSSHYGSDQKTAPLSIVGRLYVTPPALTFPSTGCTSPRNGRKNPRPPVAPDMATCTPVCGVWTGFTPP
jgi:hypothetical protein